MVKGRASWPLTLDAWPLALGGFVVLAVAWTWPTAAHLSSRIPHDPGDPILNTWILWWNAHAVPFTREWWNPPIFFPVHGALALSEHLAGIAPIATPLQLAGASPLAAYNVALILSFALSGFFAFLLVLRLTGSRLAAACGGLAFGFGPYRGGQLAHLQVLTSQWMPLILLGLHTFVAPRRTRGQILDREKERNSRSDPRRAAGWLGVFGAAWLVQALSNGYYLLFLPVLIALWIAWFVDWRREPRTGAAILAAWAIASLPLVPMLLEYRTVHRAMVLTRPQDEIRHFSATASSFVQASPMVRLRPGDTPKSDEDYLYPGVTVPALIAAGAVAMLLRRSRQPVFAFYAAAAGVMWLLAFGPAAPDEGLRAVLRPYTLLSHLPGFEGLRVPARFAMLATLAAAIAAGLAAAFLAPQRRSRRAAFGAVVLAGLAADGWLRPMPLFPPPPRIQLPGVANAAIVELPLDEPSVAVSAMYRAMQHRQPLVSGYSGHIPPHYAIMSASLRRGDASPLVFLARGRPLVLVVDDRHDPAGEFRRLVRGLPGVERRETSGAGEVYVLAPAPPRRETQPGARLPVTLEEDADGPRIDLGEPRVIRTIEFPLTHRYLTLPTRMRVTVSTDGASWTTVWEDWTGGPAMEAALRDGREAPVRITVADVNARYLRCTPAPNWLWREIRLFGP
jgi:hypothetical protein